LVKIDESRWGAAIAELLALPQGHPMKRRTMEQLAVLQISLNVGQNLSTEERALAMNLTPVYEKWRQETLDEGLQQGLQREKSLIFRQLARRVGSVPLDVQAQVQALALSQLEGLGEDLLDLSNPNDLHEWLRSHS
jgi:Domain of unknown function (DUF4351)